MSIHAQETHKGFALLLALIVSSVVLAIGISILEISISQITLSSTSRESEFAFQAAHAGVDCMWYWRNEESENFEGLTTPFPVINCFGSDALTAVRSTLFADAEAHARSYTYQFQWGDPQRCTSAEMVVMNAHSKDLTLNFVNKAVGDEGEKECQEGNVCTVIFSRGYNRSCEELETSIFSLQREITVEF